jgi:FkbM family methyltransferase
MASIAPIHRSSWFRSLAYLISRWILRRPFLEGQVPGLNLRFKVKTEDVVGRHIYKYQVHEPVLSQFLVDYLKFEPGDIVIDIGANVGWYSLLLARLAPDDSQIFAFEPDPLNFELLEHNIRLNKATRITAVQKALAAEDGVQRLYQHDSNNLGRHSLLHLQDGQAVDVQTTSLDKFWNENALGARVPRFIKIDIEGYELVALRGASEVLKHCPALLCEYSPDYMRQGGLDPADLIDLLVGHGFKPYAISATGLEPVAADSLPTLTQVTDLFWQRTVST